jgi:hypothetical protein
LHHKHVACSNVLVDFNRDFTIREATNLGCAQFDAQVLCDFGSQDRVGVAGENHEIGGSV